jgi:hypothetical protein
MHALAATVLAIALPQHGVLVPGQQLARVRLGDRPAQVQRKIGRFYGVCRGCSHTTWYFTYKKFEAHGLGVEFRNGRVDALFTVGTPQGWSTDGGLDLGAPQRSLPRLPSVACGSYMALVASSPAAVTAYYVAQGRLFGFGLLRPRASVCR